MSSAICFNLDQPKILLSGNGLKTAQRKNNCKILEKNKRAQRTQLNIVGILSLEG